MSLPVWEDMVVEFAPRISCIDFYGTIDGAERPGQKIKLSAAELSPNAKEVKKKKDIEKEKTLIPDRRI